MNRTLAAAAVVVVDYSGSCRSETCLLRRFVNHPGHWCSNSECLCCSAGSYFLPPQWTRVALEIVAIDWKAVVNYCCCYCQTCYSRLFVVVVGSIGHLSCHPDAAVAAGWIC